VDDFRAINSMTLCEQIVSDLASGRKFFCFFALFDRGTLPPQITCFFRAPVAQLDRASDYGFKPNELHIVSLLCIPSQTLGDRRFSIRTALRRIALFYSKNPQTVENDREDSAARLITARDSLPSLRRLIAAVLI